MKKLSLILLALLLAEGQALAGSHSVSIAMAIPAGGGGACQETPEYSVPYSTAAPLNSTSYYYGMGYYDTTATRSICRIDLWVQSITGDPGSLTLTIYNLNQSTYAIDGAAIATSNTVDQGSITAGTYVTFTFDPPVELTQSVAYGIQHRFSGGPSATNYYSAGYKSDSPTDEFVPDGWAIKWLTGGGLSGSWDTSANKSARWYYYE